VKEDSIIAIDSGEGSARRKIIQGLIIHMIGVHGKKCISLSIDPNITRAYLALLPARLKEIVFKTGSFQIYLTVSSLIRELHDQLYLNPSNNKLIYHLYRDVLYPLQDQVIRDLQSKEFLIILDRSRISTYAYYCSIPSLSSPPISETLQEAKTYLENNHIMSYFIQSNARLSLDIASAKRYDLIAPQLNLKLKSWFSSLKNRLSSEFEVEFIPPQMAVEQVIKSIMSRVSS